MFKAYWQIKSGGITQASGNTRPGMMLLTLDEAKVQINKELDYLSDDVTKAENFHIDISIERVR